MLNGKPLPTSSVSKNKFEAVIPPDTVPKADMYIFTLRCEGQWFSERPSGGVSNKKKVLKRLAKVLKCF